MGGKANPEAPNPVDVIGVKGGIDVGTLVAGVLVVGALLAGALVDGALALVPVAAPENKLKVGGTGGAGGASGTVPFPATTFFVML